MDFYTLVEGILILISCWQRVYTTFISSEYTQDFRSAKHVVLLKLEKVSEYCPNSI